VTPGSTVASWLAPRVARVPAAFRPWTGPGAPEAPADPETLAREARAALASAADGSGPHRGAFHLLAADAFATYACQAALDDPHPDVALARVMAILVE